MKTFLVLLSLSLIFLTPLHAARRSSYNPCAICNGAPCVCEPCSSRKCPPPCGDPCAPKCSTQCSLNLVTIVVPVLIITGLAALVLSTGSSHPG